MGTTAARAAAELTPTPLSELVRTSIHPASSFVVAVVVAVSVAVAVAATAAAQLAHPSTRGRVLVVDLLPGSPHAWPEAERYVRAELARSDLDVEVLPIAERDELSLVRFVRGEARARGAMAAVLLLRDGPPGGSGSVRVWLADEVTGKLVMRTLGADDATPADVAIQTVDLLRASLLEVRVRGFAPLAPVPAAAEALVGEALEDAGPGNGWAPGLIAGVSVPLAFQGVSPFFGVRAGASVTEGRRLVLGLELMGTPVEGRHDGEQGRSTIGLGYGVAWALVQHAPDGPLAVRAGVGLGALFAWGRGNAAAEGVTVRTDRAATAMLGTRVAVRLALGGGFGLEAGVDLLVALPPIELTGDDVALGLPLLSPGIGILWEGS